jgi:hypothetical protein
MADTRVQTEVEDWVRDQWMPKEYAQRFRRQRVRLVNLSSGGVFDFDAVSDDSKIVACISTSGARTAGGNLAVGKLMKLRSDMLFLLMAEGDRKILLLTEQDMLEVCQKETIAGRLPTVIEIIHAQIPAELDARLRASRELASKEVRPTPRG